MKCPICSNDQMAILELEGVEIDFCFTCRGIWLDKGELEDLISGKEHGDALLNSVKSELKSKEKKRKCPVCKKKMEKISVRVDESFLLDRCKAHGIWFDRGELKGILKEVDKNKEIDSKLSSVLSHVFQNGSKGG